MQVQLEGLKSPLDDSMVQELGGDQEYLILPNYGVRNTDLGTYDMIVTTRYGAHNSLELHDLVLYNKVLYGSKL